MEAGVGRSAARVVAGASSSALSYLFVFASLLALAWLIRITCIAATIALPQLEHGFMRRNIAPFSFPGFGILMVCLAAPVQGDAAGGADQAGTGRAPGAVVSYPIPSSVKASTVFRVRANDTALPVEHYRDRHVAVFSADGKVDLQIKVATRITTYSIHPTSFGLKGTVEGDTLSVSFSPTQFDPQPAYLLFKINDLENLVILADPPEEKAPSPLDPHVQDVTAPPYGADPSGKLLATTAIQTAIDRVFQSGGGIVLVPRGSYRVQALAVKSGVTLHLAGGAVVAGSNSIADYEHDPTYQSSGGKHLPAVIEAVDFKNVAIRGRGWIDAADTTINTAQGAPQDVEPRGALHRVALHVANGSGFILDGIVAQDGAGWSLLLNRVDNIQINRLKLLGPMWRGNDGIDICGCNAVVDKCFVYTGDDNFCTKALHANYPLHDVHFRNSIGYGNSAGVKAGMQALSPQSEVYFENMDIIHAGRGLVVEHHGEVTKDDSGTSSLKNIYFADVRVEQVSGTGGVNRAPIDIVSNLPGSISGLFFKRISIGNFGPRRSRISGCDAKHFVTNVVFENLTIGGMPIDNIADGQFDISTAFDIHFLKSGPQPATRNSQ
jgi:hypothetical protein